MIDTKIQETIDRIKQWEKEENDGTNRLRFKPFLESLCKKDYRPDIEIISEKYLDIFATGATVIKDADLRGCDARNAKKTYKQKDVFFHVKNLLKEKQEIQDYFFNIYESMDADEYTNTIISMKEINRVIDHLKKENK